MIKVKCICLTLKYTFQLTNSIVLSSNSGRSVYLNIISRYLLIFLQGDFGAAQPQVTATHSPLPPVSVAGNTPATSGIGRDSQQQVPISSSEPPKDRILPPLQVSVAQMHPLTAPPYSIPQQGPLFQIVRAHVPPYWAQMYNQQAAAVPMFSFMADPAGPDSVSNS